MDFRTDWIYEHALGMELFRRQGTYCICLRIHYLLSTYYVPGSVMGAEGASWVLRVSPPPHLPLSLPSSLAPTLVTSAPYYWCTLRGVALPQSPQLESGNNSAYLLGLFVRIKRVIKCKALRILAGVWKTLYKISEGSYHYYCDYAYPMQCALIPENILLLF